MQLPVKTVSVVFLAMMAVLLLPTSESISCLECNAFYQGRRGATCDTPHNRTSCIGCIKVITKVKQNDGWLIRRTSEVLTKYCARVPGSQGLRKEGCYFQQNNGGYTQQCYCYSDGCNHAAQLVQTLPVFGYVVVSLGLSRLHWL